LGQTGDIHPVVGVSAHTLEETAYAEAHGGDLAVLKPVFEKDGASVSQGLEKLRRACGNPNRAMPKLALGGVTLENAGQCITAGAEGIAPIRLFQESPPAQVVAQLRHRKLR
jgi:thiamine-phosphate pyrophosphorylase